MNAAKTELADSFDDTPRPRGRLRVPSIVLGNNFDALTPVLGAADKIRNSYLDTAKGKAHAEEQKKALENELEIDYKTGIHNERAFRRLVAEKIASPQFDGGFVVVIDLNDFKWINDKFGHQFGDVILKEFAGVLQSTTRAETDVTARWHGDEFLVFLPNKEFGVDNPEDEGDKNNRHSGIVDIKAFEKRVESEFMKAVLGKTQNLTPDEQISLNHYLTHGELKLIDGTLIELGPVGFGVHELKKSLRRSGIDELIEKADAAMYKRKKARKDARRLMDSYRADNYHI